MSNTIRQLIEERLVYYEVLPYYVVVGEGSGSPGAVTRRIQAGFDVDVYGTRIEDDPPWRSHKYQLGYEELQKLAGATMGHSNSSFVEVIASYSDIYFDTGNDFQPQAMLRIRVSHRRGLDQPAGPEEQGALQRIETELHSLGIRCGKPGSR
jgi:hypothetical protein